KLKDGTTSNGKLVLIDGQQRVTAMMAALLGQQVLNKNYKSIRITIAFHPIEERFEVANSAIRRNVAWIPDIARVFSSGDSLFSIVKEYCSKNPNADEDTVFSTLSALQGIANRLVGF